MRLETVPKVWNIGPMKYKLFLIDLDDTLLDFQASEMLCFTKTLEHFGLSRSFDSIHQTYKIENRKLWTQVENGEIDKDFLKIERFKRTLEIHDFNLSPTEVSTFYLSQLPLHIVPIEGADELCEGLKKFGELGILTNGLVETQNARIENTTFKKFIDFVAISDECGFAKPDKRFFEHALKKSKVDQKDQILMIGDRLEADILGAINFGVDSIWYNPKELTQTLEIKPTRTVSKLTDILVKLG